MSANKTTDHNSTPFDDGTGLRGGTEGGRGLAPNMPGNATPSNATVGSPAGPPDHFTGRGDGGQPQRGEDTDATDAGTQEDDHGTRHPSPSEVRTRGRDEANVSTHSGFNEKDEAIERKEGRSDGNMTHLSQHNPGEPGNAVHPNG